MCTMWWQALIKAAYNVAGRTHSEISLGHVIQSIQAFSNWWVSKYLDVTPKLHWLLLPSEWDGGKKNTSFWHLAMMLPQILINRCIVCPPFNGHAQLAIFGQPPSKSIVLIEIFTVAYPYSPRQIMYLLKPQKAWEQCLV